MNFDVDENIFNLYVSTIMYVHNTSFMLHLVMILMPLCKTVVSLIIIMFKSWHGSTSCILSFCKENPPVTGGFPSQWAGNATLWYLLCLWSWTGCWTNSWVASDLIHHDAHVISLRLFLSGTITTAVPFTTYRVTLVACTWGGCTESLPYPDDVTTEATGKSDFNWVTPASISSWIIWINVISTMETRITVIMIIIDIKNM